MLRPRLLRVTAPVGEIVLRRAEAADLPAVERLLLEAGLPTAGVAESLATFVVADPDGGDSSPGSDGRLAGVAGLEVHGRDGVLRSVAVDPSLRSRGLGGRLTEAALQRAREAGLRRLYLLTTTAEAYFPRYGFRRIAREAASPAVRESVEFREACPASAVAMVLELE